MKYPASKISIYDLYPAVCLAGSIMAHGIPANMLSPATWGMVLSETHAALREGLRGSPIRMHPLINNPVEPVILAYGLANAHLGGAFPIKGLADKYVLVIMDEVKEVADWIDYLTKAQVGAKFSSGEEVEDGLEGSAEQAEQTI